MCRRAALAAGVLLIAFGLGGCPDLQDWWEQHGPGSGAVADPNNLEPGGAPDPNGGPGDPNEPSEPGEPNTPVDPNLPGEPNEPVEPNVPVDPNEPPFNAADWVGTWIGSMTGPDVMTVNGDPNGTLDRTDGLHVTFDSEGRITDFQFWAPSQWALYGPTPVNPANGEYNAEFRTHYDYFQDRGRLAVTERNANRVTLTCAADMQGTWYMQHRKMPQGTSRRTITLTRAEGKLQVCAVTCFEYQQEDEQGPSGPWVTRMIIENCTATGQLARHPGHWAGTWRGTMTGEDARTIDGVPDVTITRSDDLIIQIDSEGRIAGFDFYAPREWFLSMGVPTAIDPNSGAYHAAYLTHTYALYDDGTGYLRKLEPTLLSFSFDGSMHGRSNNGYRLMPDGYATREFWLTYTNDGIRFDAVTRFHFRQSDQLGGPGGPWVTKTIDEEYRGSGRLLRD